MHKKSPVGNEAVRSKHKIYNSRKARSTQVNYSYINTLALSSLPSILNQWLPNGKIRGNEYVACNPKRYVECFFCVLCLRICSVIHTFSYY